MTGTPQEDSQASKPLQNSKTMHLWEDTVPEDKGSDIEGNISQVPQDNTL